MNRELDHTRAKNRSLGFGERRKERAARGASGEPRGRWEVEALARVEAVVERDDAIWWGALLGGGKAAPFGANHEEGGERNGGFGSATSVLV